MALLLATPPALLLPQPLALLCLPQQSQAQGEARVAQREVRRRVKLVRPRQPRAEARSSRLPTAPSTHLPRPFRRPSLRQIFLPLRVLIFRARPPSGARRALEGMAPLP